MIAVTQVQVIVNPLLARTSALILEFFKNKAHFCELDCYKSKKQRRC